MREPSPGYQDIFLTPPMIVKDKKEDLLTYLEDTSNCSGEASLLYLPQSREEVSSCISELTAKKIPFTASAGRTGTTGGCVPGQGAIISLENLDKIMAVDKEKQTIRLESGVSLENLEKEANKFNLTLRTSPTESLALIGGAIATSASGVRGFGYGGIRNYLAEIEVCLTSGEILTVKRGEIFARGRAFDFRLGGRRFKFKLPAYNMPECKHQAGYWVKDNLDLIDLFIGSEGTLGVITSAVVYLQAVPFSIFDGLTFFPREGSALRFIEKIKELKAQGVIQPASLEFFDQNSLKLLKHEYSFIPPAAAAVYFEQEAEEKAAGDVLLERWAALIEESGALSAQSILADTPREREKVFSFRHKLPQMINEWLRQTGQVKTASDIAVPAGRFSEIYRFYREKAEAAGMDYVNFGHIGENHLHFNFLPHNTEESQSARKYLREFYGKAVSLGGTISAEHGIGKIKKPYLKIMYSQDEIRQMAAVKKCFDPHCLLGLDNIFDKELLF